MNDGTYDLELEDGTTRAGVHRRDIWLEENLEVRSGAPRNLRVGTRVLARPLLPPPGTSIVYGQGAASDASSDAADTASGKIVQSYMVVDAAGKVEADVPRSSLLSPSWREGTVVGTSLDPTSFSQLQGALLYGESIVGAPCVADSSESAAAHWMGGAGAAPDASDVLDKGCSGIGLINLLLRAAGQPPIIRNASSRSGPDCASQAFAERAVAEHFEPRPAVPYPPGTLIGRHFRSRADPGHFAVILSAERGASPLLQTKSGRVTNNISLDESNVCRRQPNFFDYAVRPEDWIVPGSKLLYDVLPDDVKAPLMGGLRRTELNCLSRRVVEQGAYVSVCRAGTVVRAVEPRPDLDTPGDSFAGQHVHVKRPRKRNLFEQAKVLSDTGDDDDSGSRAGARAQASRRTCEVLFPGAEHPETVPATLLRPAKLGWCDGYVVRYDAETHIDTTPVEDVVDRWQLDVTNVPVGACLDPLPQGSSVLAYDQRLQRFGAASVLAFDPVQPVGSQYLVEFVDKSRARLSRAECVVQNGVRLPPGARVFSRQRARIVRARHVTKERNGAIVYDVVFADGRTAAGLHRHALRADPPDLQLPDWGRVHVRASKRSYRGEIRDLAAAAALKQADDLPDTLFDKDSAVAAFQGTVQADWAAVVIHDADKGELWTRVFEMEKDERVRRTLRSDVDGSFIGRVVQSGLATNLDNPRDAPDFDIAMLQQLGYPRPVSKSLVIVPIAGRRAILGALVAANKTTGTRFTEADEAAMAEHAQRLSGLLESSETVPVHFLHGPVDPSVPRSSIRFAGTHEGVSFTARDMATVQATPPEKKAAAEEARAAVEAATADVEQAEGDGKPEKELTKLRGLLEKAKKAAATADARDNGAYELMFLDDDAVADGFEREQLWVDPAAMMRDCGSAARLIRGPSDFFHAPRDTVILVAIVGLQPRLVQVAVGKLNSDAHPRRVFEVAAAV